MKLLFAVPLALVLSVLATQHAAAHVLITDESNSHGAILHIIPDDDPVAGERSSLYFDTQDALLNTAAKVTMTVSDPSGQESNVVVKVDGSLVTADYIFPVQGVYTLTYTVTADNKTYTFIQSQRVSRGVVGSALDQPTYSWAEMLVIGAGVGLVLLIIIGFNRRRLIAGQSGF